MRKQNQLSFSDPRLKKVFFFGGSLSKKRAHRTARPISTKQPMHLVLKSSMAVGGKSFLAPKNSIRIKAHLRKLTHRFGIQLINAANVGNHLHLVLRIRNRRTYKPFICALTGAIARTVVGELSSGAKKFWDYRPYSRIVEGLKAFVGLRDYLLINRLEGIGMKRIKAVQLVKGRDAPS